MLKGASGPSNYALLHFWHLATIGAMYLKSQNVRNWNDWLGCWISTKFTVHKL